jgi:hypothetical protein
MPGPGPDLPQCLRDEAADQCPGGVFLSGHLGYPFPSPALFNRIGSRFRRAVESYAVNNDIPWIKFGKDDDKLATMSPRLRRQSATGYSHVA